MKTNVAEKVLNVAATTFAKGIGTAGLDAVLKTVSPRVGGGVMAGLEAVEAQSPASAAPGPVQHRIANVDPWAFLERWGGPVLVIALGVVAFRFGWKWAGTAGGCKK